MTRVVGKKIAELIECMRSSISVKDKHFDKPDQQFREDGWSSLTL